MLTSVIRTRAIEKATSNRWYRRTLMALEPPSKVYVSTRPVPDPEIHGVAKTRGAFDAIRRAARGMGLVLGYGVRTTRKHPPIFVWGVEAERVIDASLAREPVPQPPLRFGQAANGVWPAGFVVWSDPPRSTFLVVISDADCNFARDVIAWGKSAKECLKAVEEALADT